MCLGGHLAFRAAFDKRIKAAVCYFATDIHSHTLGHGKNDDSLDRVKDITGELIMVRCVALTRLPNSCVKQCSTDIYASHRSSAKKTPTSHPKAATSSARPSTTPASLSPSTSQPGLSTRSSAMSCRSMFFNLTPQVQYPQRKDCRILTTSQGPLRPSSRRHLLPDAAGAVRTHAERRSGACGWRGGGAGGCVLDVEVFQSRSARYMYA